MKDLSENIWIGAPEGPIELWVVTDDEPDTKYGHIVSNRKETAMLLNINLQKAGYRCDFKKPKISFRHIPTSYTLGDQATVAIWVPELKNVLDLTCEELNLKLFNGEKQIQTKQPKSNYWKKNSNKDFLRLKESEEDYVDISLIKGLWKSICKRASGLVDEFMKDVVVEEKYLDATNPWDMNPVAVTEYDPTKDIIPRVYVDPALYSLDDEHLQAVLVHEMGHAETMLELFRSIDPEADDILGSIKGLKSNGGHTEGWRITTMAIAMAAEVDPDLAVSTSIDFTDDDIFYEPLAVNESLKSLREDFRDFCNYGYVLEEENAKEYLQFLVQGIKKIADRTKTINKDTAHKINTYRFKKQLAEKPGLKDSYFKDKDDKDISLEEFEKDLKKMFNQLNLEKDDKGKRKIPQEWETWISTAINDYLHRFNKRDPEVDNDFEKKVNWKDKKKSTGKEYLPSEARKS